MRFAIAAAALTLAVAQVPTTWYAVLPDSSIPGQINLVEFEPLGGRIVRGIGSLITPDGEYPKTGTLKCEWGINNPCYFLTGVAGPIVQDTLYAISKTTGAVLSRTPLPAGVFTDNLNMDYTTTPPTLYSVTYDFASRDAAIWDFTGGNAAKLLDISGDVAGGAVYPGNVAYCAGEKHLFVGVDQIGLGNDYFVVYNVAGAPAKLATVPLAFPSPGGIHPFCNATSLVAMTAITIWNAGEDRADGLLGVIEPSAGNQGAFLFPISSSNLPAREDRDDPRELNLAGLFSEFGGVLVSALYPQYVPQTWVAGFVWVAAPFGQQVFSETNPINYYLAGVSGVPRE